MLAGIGPICLNTGMGNTAWHGVAHAAVMPRLSVVGIFGLQAGEDVENSGLTICSPRNGVAVAIDRQNQPFILHAFIFTNLADGSFFEYKIGS